MNGITWSAIAVACFALTLPADAQMHRETPEAILIEAPARAILRARLVGHADSVAARAPCEAAAALHHAGESARRAGLSDSATVLFARAADLCPTAREVLAYADILAAGDDAALAARGRAAIEHLLEGLPRGERARDALALRVMWMQHLAGHADSARATLAELSRAFTPDDFWRVRIARVHAAAGEQMAALTVVLPAAERGRGHDASSMATLDAAAVASGASAAAIRMHIDSAIATRDRLERESIERMGGRARRFAAADGETLGLAVFPTDSAKRPRVAVVIVAPGDSVIDHEQLVLGLRNAGFTTALLWARGDGRSATPGCPGPAAWRGREDVMESLVASDMLAVAAALTREYKTRRGNWLAIGSRSTAGIGALAASRDPHAIGLVLASAEPPEVDRGVTRARVASLAGPVFLQIAPEDLVDLYYYSDALLQASRHRTSRVSESRQRGRGVEQFDHDPRSMRLLREWLDAALPSR